MNICQKWPPEGQRHLVRDHRRQRAKGQRNESEDSVSGDESQKLGSRGDAVCPGAGVSLWWSLPLN